jgi:hypothetical protein
MNTLFKKLATTPLSPPERNHDFRAESAAMDAVGVAIQKLNTVDRRAERSVRDLIKDQFKDHIEDSKLLKGFLSKLPHNSLGLAEIEKIVTLLEPEQTKATGFHQQFNRLSNFPASLFVSGTPATQGALIVTAFERLKVCAELSASSDSPLRGFLETMPIQQLFEIHEAKFKFLISDSEPAQAARERVLKVVSILNDLPKEFVAEDSRTVLISSVTSQTGAKPGLKPENLLQLIAGMHEKYQDQPSLLGAGVNLATWFCLKAPSRLDAHIEQNRDTILCPASIDILQELMFRE